MDNKTGKSTLKTLTSLERAIIVRRLSSNEPVSVLATEFGVSCRTIRRWSRNKINTANTEAVASSSLREATRKKQKSLNLEDREIILNRLDSGETIESLAQEYGVSTMTIRRIRQNKEQLLRRIASVRNSKGSLEEKNVIGAEESITDKTLYAWFVQKRSAGDPVSGNVLKKKALLLNKEVNGPASFKASSGWLCRFKERHGIHQISVQGEKLSSDQTGPHNFSISFNKLLQDNNYTMDQLYNADESGLYWKALPTKTLISDNERKAPGDEESTDRVTLMFCANASGTHKMPLLMIGKSTKPRCFKNVEMDKLPVKYIGQKSAWMDRKIFLHWYTQLYLPEIKKQHPNTPEQPRKVLLILDNAPSHHPIDELNAIDKTCQVMYLSPNVTALIQPMDQGIIEKTKRLYRKHWLCELLLQKDEASIYAQVNKLNLKDCCHTIGNAWDQVTPVDAQRAWEKLLQNRNWIKHPEAYHSDVIHVLSLINRLPGFQHYSYEDAKAWLEADQRDNGWEVFSVHEILKRIESGVLYNEDSENDEELLSTDDDSTDHFDESSNPTAMAVPMIEDAIQGLDTFFKWFETRWECQTEDLVGLQSLKQRSLDLL